MLEEEFLGPECSNHAEALIRYPFDCDHFASFCFFGFSDYFFAAHHDFAVFLLRETTTRIIVVMRLAW